MADKKKFSIQNSVHPEYLERSAEWDKFRYVMKGGEDFIEQYVEQFCDAEGTPDFNRRKRITPIGGFAKAAVMDVKNSIFQRMGAIKRTGGTESWHRATNQGKLGGVDLEGSTMNHFIGTKVLPELLAMGKVGVYVDNHRINEKRTLRDKQEQHPYLYTFVAEDIRNWEYFLRGSELRLAQVLLRVRSEIKETYYGMYADYAEQYRHYYIDSEGIVWCQTYNAEGSQTDIYGDPSNPEPVELELNEIPFVILELQSSLLQDIANHQIAITNMESADVAYALRSNVPFYTEQFDQKFEAAQNMSNEDYYNVHEYDEDNSDQEQRPDNPKTIKVGSTDGRRYPIGVDRPGFIHPSSEPLQISMEKQKALKDDIRTLVNLAVANTRSRFASAESKQMDERGLESGLSAIGLVLEHGERRVGELWSDYEDSRKPLTVRYPERYSLRSDEDRRKDAEQLSNSSSDVASPTFRKAIQKEIASILLGGKVSDEEFDKIIAEINDSRYPTADPEQIRSDAEIGLVSRETASLARNWPKGEAEKAKKEKEDAELMRMKAQSKGFGETDNPGARGLEVDSEGAKLEKQQSQDPENDPDGKRRVRGRDKRRRKNGG
jgi:hypothetical protein